jgi:hypothetical protein
MNMFDLSEWRKQNITDVYHTWQNLVSLWTYEQHIMEKKAPPRTEAIIP